MKAKPTKLVSVSLLASKCVNVEGLQALLLNSQLWLY